jgi:hypothetical protein
MQKNLTFQQRLERVGLLVDMLEATADPAVRTTAKELVGTVMELHGVGMERVLEIVGRSGEASAGILESLSRDPLIGSLLILHGLHPVDLETRVRRAIEGVAGAEIIALEEGLLRVSVRHGGEAALREALTAAAPDLADVAVVGASNAGFVPLSALCANGAGALS